MMTGAPWTVHCDASVVPGVSAAGAWIVRRSGVLVERHSLDLLHSGHEDCLTDVSIAELYTIRLSVRRMRRLAKGEVVRWYSDSKNAVEWINGNRRPPVQAEESVRIARVGISTNFAPGSSVRWIPRERNEAADAAARRNREKRGDRVLVYHEDGSVEERHVDRFTQRVYSVCSADGGIKKKLR